MSDIKDQEILGKSPDVKNKDILKRYGEELMSFCQRRFGFEYPPNLFYVTDQDNYHKLFGKTAYYDPAAKSVVVYIRGRHPKDILRSLAHELVHHTQNLSGKLVSGYFGPGYAQKNSKARECERDAYERGNLAFRDWEDQKKNKFKGEQIMIENNLGKAVKLLVENKLREMTGEPPISGGSLDATEIPELGADELDPASLLAACPGAEGDLEYAKEMYEEGLCEGGADDADLESEREEPIDYEGGGDLDPESYPEAFRESKIITPEQEESFHSKLFGTRLVALNAKLMSNFIKK